MKNLGDILGGFYNAVTLLCLLWLEGVKHALRLHRCIVYCVYEPQILSLSAQCFLLNGVIFLGSIAGDSLVLQPFLHWVLNRMLGGDDTLEGALRMLLHILLTAMWLLPVYGVSIALNCCWYQQVAELAVTVRPQLEARAQGKPLPPRAPRPAPPPGGLTGLTAIAAEVYRALLFVVIFAQVCAIGYLPLVGPVLNFISMAWLYALYSYDYKWSLRRQELGSRIKAFEDHWPFFLGFGSVCTVLLVFLPFFTGAAVMATAYPLFVLVACDSDPIRASKEVMQRRQKAGRGALVTPLPIFRSAISATNFLINNVSYILTLPALLARHRRAVAGSILAAAAAAAAAAYFPTVR